MKGTLFVLPYFTPLLFQSFTVDYNKFQEKIKYLDLRLASIINQGFDDCGSLEAVLKVSFLMFISLCIIPIKTV